MGTRTANALAVVGGVITLACTTWLSTSSRAASSAPPAAALSTAPEALTLSVAEAPTIGRAEAPIWVIEFADFRCRYCRQFANDVMPVIRRNYVDRGLVRFAFMHAPAGPLRPLGVPSAEIAACAARQGMFWQVHDLFFGGDLPIDERAVEQVADRAGLVRGGVAGLDACLSSGAGRLVIGDMAAIAYDASVHATPTVFLGYASGATQVKIVRRLSDKNIAGVSSAIDELLKR